MRYPLPAEVRFWQSFVPDANGCWLWTKVPNKKGYAHISIKHRKIRAHRWAYEYLRGPIPEGLQLDHLCRVRHCVNPRHMEIVPNRVNALRGRSVSAFNARKTHCPHGHPYDQLNTYYDNRDGHRRCRACDYSRGPT